MASHHQCCGMERAPMAVESVSQATPTTATELVVLHTTSVSFGADFYPVALSNPTHAPPGDIPIYLTTQRFLI